MKLKFLHDWLSKLVLLAGMVRQCSPAVTGSLHHMQTESVVELRCCIYVQFKIKLFFTTQIRTCIMMNPQNFLGNRHCSLHCCELYNSEIELMLEKHLQPELQR